jgi:hypothetical protein
VPAAAADNDAACTASKGAHSRCAADPTTPAAGVFCSSWVGETFIALGEWIIKRLPLIKHIYSASKQVSAAINPDSEGTRAFQECVLIKHPRNGTYAFGFITGKTLLSTSEGDTRLNCIYVPTNHIYVGDIFLLKDEDVIHTNLSVREGIGEATPLHDAPLLCLLHACCWCACIHIDAGMECLTGLCTHTGYATGRLLVHTFSMSFTRFYVRPQRSWCLSAWLYRQTCDS